MPSAICELKSHWTSMGWTWAKSQCYTVHKCGSPLVTLAGKLGRTILSLPPVFHGKKILRICETVMVAKVGNYNAWKLSGFFSFDFLSNVAQVDLYLQWFIKPMWSISYFMKITFRNRNSNLWERPNTFDW